MANPYKFREVDGIKYLVLTRKEWQAMSKDYKSIIAETSPMHTRDGWPVGTKAALCYDTGTCLAPVIIEG